MKKILLIGAGRSSSALIRYLFHHAPAEHWEITVGDFSKELALEKTKGTIHSRAIAFDINNEAQRAREIGLADLVISLLPPALHILAAKECIKQHKHLVTASYITPEIRALHEEAVRAGILIMNECGLDPGIDHMSAMQIIHDLQEKGAVITSFKSYTGGLIAPESNDNPWGYKFTWNPRNVILAGQGTAKFIENGSYKYIPYNRLFTTLENIEVTGHGIFDGYANRDSLAYRQIYNLDQVPTLLRGTLRNEGFCKAWNVFVKLGITDDTYIVDGSGKMTYADFISAFLPGNPEKKNLLNDLAHFCDEKPESELMDKIRWTGILADEPIGIPNATPAQILQHLLEQKWYLKPEDKDMIVMQHTFDYLLDNFPGKLKSSLVVKGEDQTYTAMAKTVGLPLGIVAKLILNKKIKLTGIHLPVMQEVYAPVLKELQTMGIVFDEELI